MRAGIVLSKMLAVFFNGSLYVRCRLLHTLHIKVAWLEHLRRVIRKSPTETRHIKHLPCFGITEMKSTYLFIYRTHIIYQPKARYIIPVSVNIPQSEKQEVCTVITNFQECGI